ncbi:hypothetical protein ACRQ1B_18310 [Rhizobium panacihumi]|uniref:hypothetical protein n=1 Tax=Rhizobium panacihumi TaxID=2008450 RepID=UPI003D7A274E
MLIQPGYGHTGNAVAVMHVVMGMMVVAIVPMPVLMPMSVAVRYARCMQSGMLGVGQMGMIVRRMAFDTRFAAAANGTHRQKSSSRCRRSRLSWALPDIVKPD